MHLCILDSTMLFMGFDYYGTTVICGKANMSYETIINNSKD
jgi:hypothetical protein